MERMYERRIIKLFNRSILRFNIIHHSALKTLALKILALKTLQGYGILLIQKKVICQNLLVEQIINFINYENLNEKELFSMSIT